MIRALDHERPGRKPLRDSNQHLCAVIKIELLENRRGAKGRLADYLGAPGLLERAGEDLAGADTLAILAYLWSCG